MSLRLDPQSTTALVQAQHGSGVKPGMTSLPGVMWPKGAARSPVLRHFAEIIRRAAGTSA